MSIVLISGGSGMIGTTMARELQARGHQVAILTRQADFKSRFGESVPWDGIHPGPWMEWVSRADWIIHLAGDNIGAGRWSAERLQQIRESRVFSGELLAEAVHRSSHRPSAFVQMSAIGYYGTQSPNDPDYLDESSPPGVDRLAGICREWEKSTTRVEDLGIRRLVIRTGLVLSPKGGVLSRLELPFRFFVGGPMGNGRQVYSWIHLADLVEGILYLLEKPDSSGVYNFTAPEPVRNSEFSSLLGKVIKRPSWLPVPAFTLRLVLGEMSTLILDGQRVLPTRLINESGYAFKYPGLESALRQIHPD